MGRIDIRKWAIFFESNEAMKLVWTAGCCVLLVSYCTASPLHAVPRDLSSFKNATDSVNTLLDIEAKINTLRHANWTTIVADFRDPQSQPYLVAIGMVISFVLCFFGNRSIWIWLFLCGFLSFFLVVYLFAPLVFDTNVCCGPGTERTLLAICIGAGLFGAIASVWAFRAGLAIAGAGAGLGLAMWMRPALNSVNLLRSDEDFVILCICFAAVAGIAALLKPKPLVVLATALSGAFGFVAGISYFQDCNFASTVLHAEKAHPGGASNHLSRCNATLLSVWLAMSLTGMLAQYRLHELPCRQRAESKAAAAAAVTSSSAVSRSEVRRRLAEVLAEARRLKLHLDSDSDSADSHDAPPPRRRPGGKKKSCPVPWGRGGRRAVPSTSEEDSADEDGAGRERVQLVSTQV
jgi:hypothetical protein